jgi:tetratricopeptide (TPR) repeat protein
MIPVSLVSFAYEALPANVGSDPQDGFMISVDDQLLRAVRLYEQGQALEAERLARPLLQYAPDHVQLLTLLATTAQNRGDLDQARSYWMRVVQAPGAGATHWNSLGLCHISSGRLREAAQAFEQAIRIDPKFADSLNNLGLAMQDLGDRDAAGRFLEQAIRVNPRFTAAHCNLGHHYRRLCRYEDATRCFNNALVCDPCSADAANGLGMVLHEQGDITRASHYYREALRVRPRYSDASNNLATALKEQGHLDAAVAQYRETLALVPHHPYTIYNLSQFAAEGRYKFEPNELAHLKQVVASGEGSPLERSLICFAIAAVHDADRAHDEAFEYYRKANELRKQSTPRAGFNATKHRELVDRIIKMFDGDYFRDTRGWGTSSETPIFIVGMPRTGSTLVEQILATDPKVFAAGELGELPRLMQRLCQQMGEPDLYHSKRPFPTSEAAQHFTNDLLAYLDKLSNRAPRVTIKTLENVLHLGTIATILPGARIIHCVRDPLDVCVSCYFQNFESLDFSWDLGDIASYWKDHERLIGHWQKKLPSRIHEVRYEDLIRHPEKVTKELFAFSGLEWDAKCLRYFENRVPVRTASTVQVRKPLSTKPIGRWQRYRSHLGPLLEALGYPASEQAADAAAPLPSMSTAPAPGS